MSTARPALVGNVAFPPPKIHVSRAFLLDESISIGAKGLYIWLLTRPDDLRLDPESLAVRHEIELLDAEQYIDELVAAGCLKRYSVARLAESPEQLEDYRRMFGDFVYELAEECGGQPHAR